MTGAAESLALEKVGFLFLTANLTYPCLSNQRTRYSLDSGTTKTIDKNSKPGTTHRKQKTMCTIYGRFGFIEAIAVYLWRLPRNQL